MKTIWYTVQAVLAALGGFIAWFLGGIDGYLYVLAAFIVADYVTGVIGSIVEGRLSSRICAKGIFKKVLILILIGLSNMVDVYLLEGYGVFRTIVVFFYISNEGISILENAHAIGLPIPIRLRNFLQQLRDEEDKKINKKENVK